MNVPEVAPELLAILVCPHPTCRARLEQRGDRLVCTGCGRRYRIAERWIELIPEDAEPGEGGGPRAGGSRA